MNRIHFLLKRPLCLLLVFAVVYVVGCDGAAQEKVAMRRACLSTLAISYHRYFEEHKVGPPGVEEFAEFIEKDAGDDKTKAEAVKRLRDLDIVVFWNGLLEADGDANDKYLLAFEAACPGSGGYVVMGGGFVDHVNAKEYGELTEIPKKELPVAKEVPDVAEETAEPQSP